MKLPGFRRSLPRAHFRPRHRDGNHVGVLAKVKKWKRSLAIIAVLILVAAGPGIYLLLRQPKTAQAAWFDSNWGFRQRIPLSNTGTAQTDFQIQLTIDTSALVTAGKLQADCDDVRLTDISGNSLPYWIEPSTCNTSASLIWVKVPSVPTASSGETAQIYFYYGNPDAAAPTENRANTVFMREITNLVAAYKMDEGAWAVDCATGTVLDSSGNNNRGLSCPAGTGPAGGATGIFDNAGLFTASASQYVYSTNSASLQSMSAEGSISVWVKYTTFDGTLRTIADVNSTGITGLIFLAQHTSCTSNRPGIQYGDGSITRVACATTTPSTATWYNMVATWSNEGAKLYFNGALQGTNTAPPAINITQTNTFLGSNAGTVRFLDGNLDDLQFYNKALTQAEVTDLAGTNGNQEGYTTTKYPNTTLVRKFSASVTVGTAATEEAGINPVGYWKFDEAGGQVVNDSTSNNISGVMGASSTPGEASDPTWQPADQCVSGSCIYVNGAVNAQYALLGNVSQAKIGTKTVSFWAKPIADLTVTRGVVSLGTVNWYVGFTTSNRMILSRHNSSSVQVTAFSKNNAVIPNEWHFYTYAVTVSGTSVTIQFYRDAQLVGTYTDPTGGQGATYGTALRIGTITTNATNAFIGFIDEVKIYGYTRTQAQIFSDYVQGAAQAGSSSVQGYEPESLLSNGLQGYWKLDEVAGDGSTLADASQNGNTATAVLWGGGNTSTDSAHVQGKFANGFSFDGGDDYLNVADATSLDLGTGDFTLSSWVKTTDTTNATRILTKGGGGNPLYQLIKNTNGTVSLFVRDSSVVDQTVTSAESVTDGSWHLVTGTKTSSTLAIYVDGKLQTTATYSGGSTDSSLPLTIGQFGTNILFFNGTLDEVRIYKRAFSAADVQTLYNWGPGPTAYYRLDEHTGTSANDVSGNSNTGTLENGPNWVTGKYGTAVNFDSTTEDINIPDSDNKNDFVYNQDFTVGAWIKAPTNQLNVASSANSAIEKWSSVGGYPYVIRINNQTGASSGKYTFARYDGTNNPAAISTATYNDNLFHYITFTKSGSTLAMYFDGKLDKTFTDTTTGTTTNASSLFIGNRGGTNYAFNGVVDDLKIYSYARSPAQVAEDMRGGATGITGGISNVGGTASSTQPVTPAGYWKFDESYSNTAHDMSGTSNGTITGATWTAGKVNSGLSFSSASTYVNIPIQTPINPTTAITVEAWVKPSTVTLPAGGGIVVNNSRYGFYQVNSTIKAWIRKSDNSNYVFATTGNVLTVGEWTHVVKTFDGQKLTIWINGKPVVDTYYTGTMLSSASPWVVGNFTTAADTRFFSGEIDEVKIYPFALTQEQINLDYNLGLAMNYNVGSTTEAASDILDGAGNPPIALWNFEERTGSTVNDSSGNAETGTWQGTLGGQWVTGKIGAAGNFNGTDNYVSFASAVTGIKSIGFWINPATTTQSLIDFGDASVHYIDMSSGTVTATGFSSPTIYVNGISGGTVTANTWNYIEITTATAFDSTSSIVLGQQTETAQFFRGRMDEVSIYNYTRTAAQAAYDYNRGAPLAWWKMDDCQGSTAYDAAGKSNNGTITIGTGAGTGHIDAVGTCSTAGTSWGDGAAGKVNSGIYLDGIDDYVFKNMTVSPTDGTVALWVKNPGGVDPTDYLFRSTANLRTYFQFISTDRVVFVKGNPAVTIATTPVIPSDTWTHLTLAWWTSGGVLQAVAYYNGRALTLPITFSDSTIGGYIVVGAFSNVGSFYSSGIFDDVRYYNYALSATQVQKLYNSGFSAFYGPSSGSP